LDSAEFSRARAQRYNCLQWAMNEGYLNGFLDFAGLQSGDEVLDLGTGTGLVARRAIRRVKKVVGLDNSPDMLKIAALENPGVGFVLGDARRMPFRAGSFDKVLARMIFHHLTEGLELALDECRRVLRPGGTLAVSEGVPPCPEVKPEYVRIFKLKEKRLTFLPEDLAGLLTRAGFVNLVCRFCLLPRVSVRNWLENSGCPEQVREEIMRLHIDSSDLFKKAYDLVFTENDCLINMHFFMVRGERP